MLDLQTVTHEDFAACLNQPFKIPDRDKSMLIVQLVEAEPRGSFDPEMQTRQPFSLLFRGPPEPLLPQGLYRMNHRQLGDLELFLVPIGPDRQGMRYEAVFT